jgi:hypothetical protein
MDLKSFPSLFFFGLERLWLNLDSRYDSLNVRRLFRLEEQQTSRLGVEGIHAATSTSVKSAINRLITDK